MEDSYHLGIKALITNSKSEILLLKVNPAALKKQVEPYWDLPGGRIKKGDSVEQTLLREVREETGVDRLESIKEIGMVLSNIRIPLADRDVGLILGIYSCKIADDSSIKLSEEHTESRWFSAEEAAELLKVKYPASFTDKIKSSVVYTATLIG